MNTKLNWRTTLAVLALGICFSPLALAHDGQNAARADGHAPIGVMGDHMHSAGEWMIGYRFAHMSMSDSQLGSESVTPDWIVTNAPNRFFGNPMQPASLRIVPLEMEIDMHMAGLMYAPTDWLTLTAATSYLSKEMEAVTYQGMIGTTRLGNFSTQSSGWGDSKLIAMFRLYREGNAHIQFNAGVSLPTGSITETDQVLTPMGTRPEMRLPYGMQLGTGTFNLMPALTYTDRFENTAWGAQYAGTFHIDENAEGYAHGDSHQISGWISYQAAPWISGSIRLTGRTQSTIDGIDLNIMGPASGADPDNHGGDRIDLSFGVNLIGQEGLIFDHRLALELILPLHQEANGLQMRPDWRVMIGYQKAF